MKIKTIGRLNNNNIMKRMKKKVKEKTIFIIRKKLFINKLENQQFHVNKSSPKNFKDSNNSIQILITTIIIFLKKNLKKIQNNKKDNNNCRTNNNINNILENRNVHFNIRKD